MFSSDNINFVPDAISRRIHLDCMGWTHETEFFCRMWEKHEEEKNFQGKANLVNQFSAVALIKNKLAQIEEF